MEEALVAFLLSKTAVTAKLGNRIWWDRAPQGQKRVYAVLQVIGSPRDYTMKGSDGLKAPRVQIDVYGDRYGDVAGGMRAILGELDGYLGMMGPISVQGIFIEDERDIGSGRVDDTDRPFRKSADIKIFHS